MKQARNQIRMAMLDLRGIDDSIPKRLTHMLENKVELSLQGKIHVKMRHNAGAAQALNMWIALRNSIYDDMTR